MAVEYATRIPEKVTAGDTIKFEESWSGYPQTSWTLKYHIVGESTDLGTFTATANGDAFRVTIAIATTAAWAAGVYSYEAYVEDDPAAPTERVRVKAGTIEVTANLATVDTHDGRTHAKIVLDAIEAVIEGRATKDQDSYAIAGRSLSRTPIPDLLTLRDKYRSEYAQELRAQRIAQGLGHSGIIRTRFN